MKSGRLTIELSQSTGDKLFDIVEETPLHSQAEFLSLRFRPKNELPSNFVKTGAGLYFIAFDNQLIYIGKFLGSKRSISSGNILTSRWDKHLGTLSMRGFRTTMKPRTSAAALAIFPKHEICKAYSEPLIHASMTKDRGCVSSINRLRFAIENWSDFKRFDEQTLSRFEFSYARFGHLPESLAESRSLVTRIEAKMIAELRPRCNRESEPGAVALNISDHLELLTRLLESELTLGSGKEE